jgi:N-acylneuraminate cytidylyltransferase
MTRWVALMPLRGGSRSIASKNLRRIAGRPLFAWSLEQARVSQCFQQLFVSTDADAIRSAVKSHFPSGVELIDRSPESATDMASTESVMLEFQHRVAFDVLCLIQATSPLTLATDFVSARDRFEAGQFDSLLTGVEMKRFLWSRDGRPLNYDPRSRPRRQDFEGAWMENGAFYFTRAGILSDLHCRLGGKIAVHPMSAENGLEVDEPADWDIVEQLLLRRQRHASRIPALGRIAALIVDVDGTLTDGGMYYGAGGESLKKFNTRDALGLARVRERGIRVCVMSGEDSAAVGARMRKLGITEYHPGTADKAALMRRLAVSWSVELDRIAYVGDDLSDLHCLQQAGFSACPADAMPAVSACANYVCGRTGGAGAIREVCDLILAAATPAA